jgi:hypothetical protein
LVYVVEDWETIEEYAGDKQGFYQILSGGKGVEIRVAVGRLGFKQSFEDAKDQLLDRIVKFCGIQDYVKVSENIGADYFFK